jgi:hypothetical protein
MGRKRPKLNNYSQYGKQWDKGTSRKVLDPELVDYYINNDLPLDELFDSLDTKWDLRDDD